MGIPLERRVKHAVEKTGYSCESICFKTKEAFKEAQAYYS